jgi:DNA-binding GntR family transcriptional regulator
VPELITLDTLDRMSASTEFSSVSGAPGLPLRRSLLRDQVRIALIDRIVHGQLVPGDRLNEAQLASELQISRTPLKEAILAMEREGFVQASAGRGHVVTPLSRSEVEDTYPMLMAYEALILARYPPDKATLKRMASLNTELSKTDDPFRRLEIDEAFHAAIANGCPNGRLLYSMESLELVIRRYSSRYPLRAIDPKRSVADHRAIVRALTKGDTFEALRALERHWDHALGRLLAAMDADPPDQAAESTRTSALGPLPSDD